MTFRAKLLLTLYVLMTFTVALGGAWIANRASTTMRDVTASLKGFERLPRRYFENTQRIPAAVDELRQLLPQIATQNDPAVTNRLVTISTDLRKVFAEQRELGPPGKLIIVQPRPATFDVAQWENMDRNVSEFLGTVAQMVAVPSSPDGVREGYYKQAVEKLMALSVLVTQAQAEADSITRWTGFKRRFDDSELLLLAVVVCLTALCSWLTLSVYRLLIAKTRLANAQTELREARSALERQSILALKAQVARELAHELTTPITAIDIRIYSLEMGLAQGSTEREDAAAIRRGIQRLKEIFRAYRELEGLPAPNLVTASTRAVLREVLELQGPVLAQTGIVLKLDSIEDVPFRADPRQIQQVLVNLVKNAAEAIAHSGHVILRGHVILHARRGTATLRSGLTNVITLGVQDNGPGIPEDVQKRMFDPFFTTKQNEGGTGIGLSVASRIVDLHGGRLEFDTKIGQGTTFRIVLPAEPQA